MKKIFLPFILLSMLLIFSCGKKQSKDMTATVDQLNALTAELNTKFPDNVAFQSIMFSFDELFGNTIFVKVVENMDSAEVQEWFFASGKWELSSENTIFSDSTNITDKLFSINGDYDLSKLSNMIGIANQKIEEKEINDAVFKSINLLLGNSSAAKNKMDNLITQLTVASTENGKSYLVDFDVNGNFVSISEEFVH